MADFVIQPHQTRALITGASTGIGYELAKIMAAHHINMVLVARKRSRLEIVAEELRKAHGVTAEVIDKDLLHPHAPQELFDAVSCGPPIDILVNNAGFGVHGLFHETLLPDQLELLQVNIAALVHLTRLFLPGMVQRGRGRVLNVASTAAYQPGPYMATYYASKAFVLSFSEAIDAELPSRGNVRVTSLNPGPTTTEFHTRAKIKESPLFKANTMDAKTVAEMGYRAMIRGQRSKIAGVKNYILSLGSKIAPRHLVTKMAGKLNRVR